jgi:uncharacterized protein (TIGR02145 family)
LIPEAKTVSEWYTNNPAWCYYNNDPSTAAKYGKLYNPAALNDPRGLAPIGWHIPSFGEFVVLVKNAQPKANQLKEKIENAKNLGIDYTDLKKSYERMMSNEDNSKQIAAYTLRSTSGWKDYGGKDDNGTNVFGFNAFPCPRRDATGKFKTGCELISYWTSSKQYHMDENNEEYLYSNISYELFVKPMYYYKGFYSESGQVNSDEYLYNIGLPIRCVKD